MKRIVADLHIHTCLSPCAELDMTPRRIMRRARDAGLQLVAVADHNSAENLVAAVQAAREEGVALVPALEVCSREEAHVLAFFETAGEALGLQEKLYRRMPEPEGDPVDWQVVVNEHDEVLGFNRRLLIGATGYALAELVEEIRALGGLAVASHVDRGAFSVMSQLGFVPEDLRFDAFEVIEPARAAPGLIFHPGVARIASSDAHHLADIGQRRTSLLVEEASFAELRLALEGAGGRGVAEG